MKRERYTIGLRKAVQASVLRRLRKPVPTYCTQHRRIVIGGSRRTFKIADHKRYQLVYLVHVGTPDEAADASRQVHEATRCVPSRVFGG